VENSHLAAFVAVEASRLLTHNVHVAMLQ
jgi:hypothetical protein